MGEGDRERSSDAAIRWWRLPVAGLPRCRREGKTGGVPRSVAFANAECEGMVIPVDERSRDAGSGLPITLRDVTVSFPTREGGRLVALRDFSLDVPAGSVTALIGPNGCGKSTALRVIAGLLTPDQGIVGLDGGAAPHPGDGRVGLVFQQPRLIPWLSTIDNVALPLAMARVALDERRARAGEALRRVGLEAAAQVRPGELSGGMAQRAALARALVSDPPLLLLDEPFSALDALTREAFDSELQVLWMERPLTVLLVTHAVSEAVRLADRIVVLTSRPGRVAAIVAVDLPRPRPVALAGDPRAAAIEDEVRQALAGVRPAELVSWTEGTA
jgi:NitT/TauT family transport system ATP-binding protein